MKSMQLFKKHAFTEYVIEYFMAWKNCEASVFHEKRKIYITACAYIMTQFSLKQVAKNHIILQFIYLFFCSYKKCCY